MNEFENLLDKCLKKAKNKSLQLFYLKMKQRGWENERIRKVIEKH